MQFSALQKRKSRMTHRYYIPMINPFHIHYFVKQDKDYHLLRRREKEHIIFVTSSLKIRISPKFPSITFQTILEFILKISPRQHNLFFSTKFALRI